MRQGEYEDTFQFQLQLLLNIEEMKAYPFTKLVIEMGLTREEYEQTMDLLANLSEIYEEEKESGFIHHAPLLLHFAGMLCHKLPVEKTIHALFHEGRYPDLMERLIVQLEANTFL